MNSHFDAKIREIAQRMWAIHPRDIDAMGLKTRTAYYEKELTDFAESVIKECARVDSELLNEDHVDGESYNFMLLDHFGIKD